MREYISDTLKNIVFERAKSKCEYCLISEMDVFHALQIEHIISVKHGGSSKIDNLALACSICNRNKGSDVGTYLFVTDEFVRFYNPRRDKWGDHFYIKDGLILPKTNIGKGTIKILNFNDEELVIDRRILIKIGLYPS